MDAARAEKSWEKPVAVEIPSFMEVFHESEESFHEAKTPDAIVLENVLKSSRSKGLIDVADMVADLGRDYLVKGMVERGKLHFVYGPSGHGKTFLTVDLCCHIGSGLEWRGKRVKPAPVFYIASEAGRAISNRFVAWREHHKEKPLVSVYPRSVNVMDVTQREEVMGMLRSFEEYHGDVGLVVLDTLSRSMAGANENAAQDMTIAISFADMIRDEFGAAVIFVHHTGKDTEKGLRGSSSLAAAGDINIKVENKVAECDKSRDGPTGVLMPFELKVFELGEDDDGDPVTTCVVEHLGEEAKPKRRLPPGAFECLKCLQVRAREGVAPGYAGNVLGCEIEVWWEEYKRVRQQGKDLKNDSIRTAFNRHLVKLRNEKRIDTKDGIAWLL